MDKIPIVLIAVLLVAAYAGGYYTAIINSADNFTLNVTNKTNDSGSYEDDVVTTNYNKKTTVKTNTTKTTTPTPPTPTNTKTNTQTNGTG